MCVTCIVQEPSLVTHGLNPSLVYLPGIGSGPACFAMSQSRMPIGHIPRQFLGLSANGLPANGLPSNGHQTVISNRPAEPTVQSKKIEK